MNQTNAVQIGIPEMTKPKSKIAYNKSRRELGVNELMRHYLENENLSEGINQVLTLLKSEGISDPREGRQHEEAACHIAVEDLTEAETVMNNLHLGTPDNACKLMQLQVDLKRANKQMKDMSKVQELEVRQVASEIEYKAGVRAQSMLKAGFAETSKEVIKLPGQNQLKTAPWMEESTGQLPVASDLRVFPNPFRDYTTIETYLPDEYSIGQLRIIDLFGITQKVLNVQSGYNHITLLKDDLLNSGIYFCVIEANEKVIDKTKFVVIK